MNKKNTVLCFWIIIQSSLAFAQHREIDSLENNLNRYADTVKVLMLIRLSELYEKIDFQRSVSYGDEARAFAHQIKFYRGEFQSIDRVYRLLYTKGEFVKAIDVARDAISIAEEIDDPQLMVTGRRMLGSAYLRIDLASKAIEEFTAAYRLVENLDDKELMGWILNGLGNAHNIAKNYDYSREYYERAIASFQQIGYESGVANVLINLGELLVSRQKYAEAMDYFLKALELVERLKDERMIAYILSQLAENYSRLADYDKAISMYNRALHYHNKSIEQGMTYDLGNKSFCLTGLGNVKIRQGRYAEAVTLLEEAYATAEVIKWYNSGLARTCSGLAEAYGKMNNYTKAYYYRSRELVIRDSVDTKNYLEKLNETEARFQAENSEKELAALQHDRKINRIFISLMSGLAFLGLIAILLFISKARYRVRMDDEIMKKEKERNETELAARELVEKQLREELEFKTNDLTTYTLQLIQKNEILNEVKKEIDEIKSISADEVRIKINRLFNTINQSQRNDKDWENFKMYFDQVHKGFFENLKMSHPDLSGKDLKLCALLRLNLDSKQIATILDLSPDSVKVARHRIRKKVGLETDDNLYGFLSTL